MTEYEIDKARVAFTVSIPIFILGFYGVYISFQDSHIGDYIIKQTNVTIIVNGISNTTQVIETGQTTVFHNPVLALFSFIAAVGGLLILIVTALLIFLPEENTYYNPWW